MSACETPKFSLDDISIAKPCSMNWNEMQGDERARHCTACKLNVYNLSDMTREEAEKFVFSREGRTCVRFYRREDGTLLTQDCPVGLARIRKRMALLAGGLAASIFLAAGSVLARMGVSETAGETAAQAAKKWLTPPNPIPKNLPMPVPGVMCPPPPKVVPTPAPAPAPENAKAEAGK